jgi:hypothetical protein
MALKISGKVVSIPHPQTGKGKKGEWVKQDFVIETSEQYPKKICFSAWGQLASIVGSLNEHDEVTVSFNPESREYNGRWYTELKATGIEVESPKENTKTDNTTLSENSEDLPF